MRVWPRSLAGRLAALLVLTLVAAQIVAFALFAGERVSAFRNAYREDMLTRLVSLAQLLEEAPPGLHARLLTTAGSSNLQVELAPAPVVADENTVSQQFRNELATALGKDLGQVRTAFAHREWRGRDRRGPGRRHGQLPWARASIQLASGQWLNASAGLPPVPPLGGFFLASFLISAVATATVGGLAVRRASRPLRHLAGAADRLGRGEVFEPLPETGPNETRQANIAFNRMRERLERFIRGRTAMLAAIAHDLRTPITSLRLRAEFIEEEEIKAKILETLAEMQAMAEAVLAFARGDAEAEPTGLTNVTALVDSIVEDAAASGRDVRFEDSPPVTLACRPFALRRAIGNLLDNAAAYGVRARARIEAGPEEISILFDDDGPGISGAELERVFEPFVRLETSRSRETGGAGLGLAIARTIARAHGGDVHLQNRPGGGLRAILTLPRDIRG